MVDSFTGQKICALTADELADQILQTVSSVRLEQIVVHPSRI